MFFARWASLQGTSALWQSRLLIVAQLVGWRSNQMRRLTSLPPAHPTAGGGTYLIRKEWSLLFLQVTSFIRDGDGEVVREVKWLPVGPCGTPSNPRSSNLSKLLQLPTHLFFLPACPAGFRLQHQTWKQQPSPLRSLQLPHPSSLLLQANPECHAVQLPSSRLFFLVYLAPSPTVCLSKPYLILQAQCKP